MGGAFRLLVRGGGQLGLRVLRGGGGFAFRLRCGGCGKRQAGKDGFAGAHFVADGDVGNGIDGQIDIDARAEADKAVALAAHHAFAGVHIAEHAAGDESGHLHEGDVAAAAGGEQHGVALVFGAGFIQRGVQEFAGIVFDAADGAVHRRALGVDVKHVHKHADFQRFGLAVGVGGFFYHHDAAVGGAEHGIGIGGNVARGVAEKLDGKQGEQPKRQRPPAAAEAEDDAQHQAGGDKRPAFGGNKGVRVKAVHRFSFQE